MSDAVDAQGSLEAQLKDEILRMYQEVADNPEGEFHFSITDIVTAKQLSQSAAIYGVKAVMMTAEKPSLRSSPAT